MGSGSRLQTRWRFSRLGLVISAAAVASGAAALAAWPHAWRWVAVAAGVVAAGAPVVLSGLDAARQRRADTAKTVRLGLQGTMGPAGDALPVAAQADLDARVHRAVLKLPYIHRDVEDEARPHLAAGRPVLFVGSSMVGKTKVAATLVQDMFPARRVVIPDTREALVSLDAADILVQDSVIFLDDINRLIGAGGITDGALNRLTSAGNILIGTIRAGEYDRFQPTDQLRPPEWDVLSVFKRIFISRELSKAEQGSLAAAVDDPDVQERVRRVGLGEYAGAAEHIAEALRLGPSVSPVGFALVLGAADWQRAGMNVPVPARVVPDLAAAYLQAKYRPDLSSDQAYQAALAWATRDINPTVALLQRAEQGAFTVYDYALDLLSDQGRPIPDASWPILIQHAPPPDLLSIGYSAWRDFDQPEVAKEAWIKAAEDDPRLVPWSVITLGVLLREEGDIAGAKVAFRQTIDSGDAYLVPFAAANLGALLAGQGDVAAKAALQQAIDSGHADAAPMAMTELGALLREEGDVAGAKAAYQQVLDSGHPKHGATAAAALGMLLTEQGDRAGAKAAFQRGIRLATGIEHADAGTLAATMLGALLRVEGDTTGAKAAYQQAIDFGHITMAPLAAAGLGDLLAEQGDVAGARQAYRQAIDSGQADHGAKAAIGLGTLLAKQGDTAGARAALQEAIGLGTADVAPEAMAELVTLLAKQGDVGGFG